MLILPGPGKPGNDRPRHAAERCAPATRRGTPYGRGPGTLAAPLRQNATENHMTYPPQSGGWQDPAGNWQGQSGGGWQDPAGGGGWQDPSRPTYIDPSSGQPAYVDPI